MSHAIEIAGLTKRFGALVAVDEATFHVPHGSVYGFLGPNGSGKTTTLGMLTGLIPADGGTARILGHDVRTELPAALHEVGSLVDEPAFYPHLSGRRNLRILAHLMGVGDDAIEQALDRMGMTRYGDTRYSTYSQGMRRRLALAAALLCDPKVLILDEPTNGLDPAGQQEVGRMLQAMAAEGRTILLSSHQLGEVQAVCTDVAILHQGKVVEQGPLAEVLAVESVLEIDVDDPVRAEALLAMVDGVTGVDVDGTTLVVRAAEADAATVNRTLVEHGIAVARLVPRAGGLQERFFELTAEGA